MARNTKKISFSERVKSESLDAVIKGNDRNYIRASFVESGTISDPSKGYHLEFNMKEKKSATKLTKILSKFDISCKTSHRASSNNTILYISDVKTIENFLKVIGAQDTLFYFMKKRIEGEIGANENRKINIEIANMERTASIRQAQIKNIDYIVNKYKNNKDRLPDWFMPLAKLRKSKQNYSLSQMADKLSVSKSTIDYRLNKIDTVASDIRKNGGKIKIN